MPAVRERISIMLVFFPTVAYTSTYQQPIVGDAVGALVVGSGVIGLAVGIRVGGLVGLRLGAFVGLAVSVGELDEDGGSDTDGYVVGTAVWLGAELVDGIEV